MEILSSSRISKTILAILSVVMLSNLPVEALDLLIARKIIGGDYFFGVGSVSQMEEGATAITNDTIKFINSPQFPKRASFPPDFLFGVGSSALQIEGAAHEGGRGPGIWDDTVKNNKGKVIDADKFPTMIEHYKRYKEDVKHLKNLGINSYRMSISWSRVLPDGTLKGGVNQEGIDFYNHLINELLANGITPFVTILHFDYPLALEQKLGGFLNRSIVKYYKDYCELLFKTYGDRVKHWTTINEGEVTAIFTYMHSFGLTTPEPCQKTRICRQSYIVLHNFLLAHATAAHIYKQKFQATQGGEIGIVISSQIFIPYSQRPEDVAAAERLMDFYMGWVIEPLVHGKYPKIMRKLVKERLPKFTKKERKIVKGSADFIGINYYTSHYAKFEPNRTNVNAADNYDALAVAPEFNAEGKPLGYKDTFGGSYVYPEGLYKVLLHIKNKYKNPKIYITENGIPSMNLTNPLHDEHRIPYIAAHLNYTKAAIDKGVRVGGYFVWAAFDTFEFQAGYLGRWGLINVDFNDNLKRQPTTTAEWYRRFLQPDWETERQRIGVLFKN